MDKDTHLSTMTTVLLQKQLSVLCLILCLTIRNTCGLIPPRSSDQASTHLFCRMPLTQADYRAKLASNNKLQSQDVAKLPKPGTGSVPSSLKIKDDWITYLAPSDPTSLTRELYGKSLKTGKQVEVFQPGQSGQESDFSLEEKLRRERSRMMSTGVTSYEWASKENIMLIPLGGALWVLKDPLSSSDSSAVNPVKLAETGAGGLPQGAPLLDSKISSDGSTVAFVADKEVYVMPTSTPATTPVQVTSGARGLEGKTNGIGRFSLPMMMKKVQLYVQCCK